MGEHTLELDSEFKLRGSSKKYKFIRAAKNIRLRVEWIDCMDMETGEFRSFYPDKIVIPRKRRKKK